MVNKPSIRSIVIAVTLLCATIAFTQTTINKPGFVGNPSTGGTGSPGGSPGQIQVNSSGSFGGITLAGDCTFSSPNVTCGKTGGVSFSTSATTDTTSATNITSGTLPAARLSTFPSITPTSDATIDIGTVTSRVREITTALNSYCTTQLDKTSDTALANATGMSVTLQSGGVYIFQVSFMTTSNATGGAKFDLGGGTVTATVIRWHAEVFAGSGAASTGAQNTSLTSTVGATAAVALVTVYGYINVNVGGTLIPRFAQNASFGTASSLYAGSWMIFRRIA